jgi:hypothetical protein
MGIIRILTEEDSKPFKAGSHFTPIIPFPPGINGWAIIHHALTIEEEGPTHSTQLTHLDGWPMYQFPWMLTEHMLYPNEDEEVLETSEGALGPTLSK